MKKGYLIILTVAVALATFAVLALLINIFQHKTEGRINYLRIVDIPDMEPDPAVWKQNFPDEYDDYMKTMKTSELADYSKYGRYGGSEAFNKLDANRHPTLKKMYAGYPFSVEYREERGHMNALTDVINISRLGKNKPGTCLTCKSPQVPIIIKEIGPAKMYETNMYELIDKYKVKHSISCADCHDAKTQELKVTRPAFIEAMQRRGIDVNQATNAEKRIYVCAQCHVEYYFKKPGNYLTFPWDKGLSIDSIDQYYEEIGFKDWEHAITKAPMIKMQHPEYEMWSSGIHARSGVTCVDCHMPYKRIGSIKVTDHWIRTPLENISNACLPCHRQSEEEMKSRVLEIQDRTFNLMARAENANLAAIDAISTAMVQGVADAQLEEARKLHRKSQLRWDFVSSENSMGFHSPQEAVRMLGDSVDYARLAELSAFKAMSGNKAAAKMAH